MHSFSNQSSADIQSAVDHAVLEAVSDGRVGNLKTVPNSVRVGAPEAQKGACILCFYFELECVLCLCYSDENDSIPCECFVIMKEGELEYFQQIQVLIL